MTRLKYEELGERQRTVLLYLSPTEFRRALSCRAEMERAVHRGKNRECGALGYVFRAWWRSEADCREAIDRLRISYPSSISRAKGVLEEIASSRPSIRIPDDLMKAAAAMDIATSLSMHEAIPKMSDVAIERAIRSRSHDLDELWRETKRRKWPREKMLIFEEVAK